MGYRRKRGPQLSLLIATYARTRRGRRISREPHMFHCPMPYTDRGFICMDKWVGHSPCSMFGFLTRGSMAIAACNRDPQAHACQHLNCRHGHA